MFNLNLFKSSPICLFQQISLYCIQIKHSQLICYNVFVILTLSRHVVYIIEALYKLIYHNTNLSSKKSASTIFSATETGEFNIWSSNKNAAAHSCVIMSLMSLTTLQILCTCSQRTKEETPKEKKIFCKQQHRWHFKGSQIIYLKIHLSEYQTI